MSDVLDAIARAVGFGGPSGNDHGSSNWAAWGHEEICTMLQNTVDPGDIHEAAYAWREQGRHADDLITGLTRDLNGIVTGGWRGASADQALGALGPIDHWSERQTEIAERTTQLMDSAGSATAQTKTMMPEPVSHNWVESLSSFAVGGVPGAMIDAVAQEQAQADAHAAAVRVMTSVYSAPINDYRADVPTYLQLADPTMAQPNPSPIAGPTPGTGHSAGGGADGSVPGPLPVGPLPAGPVTAGPVTAGAVAAGAATAGGAGAPGTAHHVSAPPTPAALQGVTSGGGGAPIPGGSHHPASSQPTGREQHTAGQIAAALGAAAAGVPIVAPAAARVARSVRSGGGGVPLGAGGRNNAGSDGYGSGRVAGFGPRPTAAVEAAEPRMSGSLGHGATGTADARAGMNAMPMAPGAGPGQGKDGTERRRPSYLIEMDDVFTDGRKVAPAVIGEGPPEHNG